MFLSVRRPRVLSPGDFLLGRPPPPVEVGFLSNTGITTSSRTNLGCQAARRLTMLSAELMKDAKEVRQNIRYLGFETTSDGGRRFDFSITEKGQSSLRVTLDIPAVAFTGENRISYQESAKICYSKLKMLLENETGISQPLHLSVTRDDIARFRHVPRGRARPKD
jgi:hypothetical protein